MHIIEAEEVMIQKKQTGKNSEISLLWGIRNVKFREINYTLCISLNAFSNIKSDKKINLNRLFNLYTFCRLTSPRSSPSGVFREEVL